MAELTLESLAKRLEALEKKVAEQVTPSPPLPGLNRDWRRVVGKSEDNEFTRAMLAEIEANSDAERQAAQAENPE